MPRRPPLPFGRAADRKAFVEEARATLAPFGAETSSRDLTLTPGECHIIVKARSGLSVSFTIGRFRNFVLAWHDAPRRLCPSFGNVNAYHGCKATWLVNDPADLIPAVARGLRADADGSAYVAAA